MRTAVFTALVVGSAAMAGTAQAATISIDPVKACYLSGDKITASGTGFTAGGPVDVSIDGKSLGQLAADAAGNIAGEVSLGTMRGVKSHALTATDVTDSTLMASVSFLATTNRVIVKPKNARAGRKLQLRGSGFLAGPNVFMHVRGPGGYKSDGRVAKPQGPCGTFTVRKRIVPPGADTGSYKVQFDAVRRFSKKTRPRVQGTMRVFPRAG
jgi:hypothetical protein